MKTKAINVFTLCVPCACRCRYCLLSWDGKEIGVIYPRAKAYAERFHRWIRENRPDLDYQFYFGYSMEHPQLLEEIPFLQHIGSASGKFLQFNGLKFRTESELTALLTRLKCKGVRLIDLTIYGERLYHDRFASRKGDFDYLIQLLQIANKVGLNVEVGIPVTNENAGQIEGLLYLLRQYELEKVFLFVPHSEGRGVTLEAIRLTADGFQSMGPTAQKLFNHKKFRTEQAWLETRNFSTATSRMLGLSLTPENIDFFEKLPFPETIEYLENLDNNYYNQIPSIEILADRFGNQNGQKFYSERDLYLKYQRAYIQENCMAIYDVNDERQCFSRRY